MSLNSDINLMDTIEACRTCGIYFVTSSCYLQPIFKTALEDAEMMHIRMELSAWNLEINENDGYPQFICRGCVHEFKKIFDFRRSCMNTYQCYNNRTINPIKIKTELPDEIEESVCDFIYVDDLSDTELDGTPFNIPHVPIKEELIEEATVPTEIPTTFIGTASTNIEGSDIQQDINRPNGALLNSLTDCRITEAENEVALTSLENSNSVTGDNDDADFSSTLQIKCDYCNCISPNNHQHKLHLKRVHDIKDVVCHICRKIFKNCSRLKFHLKWHKLNKHIKCVQCGFYSTSRELLKDHVRQMHSKDDCAVCGKLIYLKKMKQHMRKHGFDTLFECSYCTKVFRNSEDVNNHIRAIHSNDTAVGLETDIPDKSVVIEILCVLCNIKFLNQSELEIHMHEQHLNEESCRNKTDEEYNLVYAVREEDSSETHELFSSMKEDSNKLYCVKCQQEFLQQDALIQHIQQCQSTVESAADMFSNAYDGTENNYLDNFKNESDTNLREMFIDEQAYLDSLPAANMDQIGSTNEMKPLATFGCAQCPDIFESVQQLRNHHEQVHNSNPTKPNFDCHICGKVFELKFSLNRHLKKHNP